MFAQEKMSFLNFPAFDLIESGTVCLIPFEVTCRKTRENSKKTFFLEQTMLF